MNTYQFKQVYNRPKVSLQIPFRISSLAIVVLLLTGCDTMKQVTYPVPDTHQDECYNKSTEIDCPSPGEAWYGQDAQFHGTQPSYTDHGDGTVTDNVTSLMWVKSPDLNGDGVIKVTDKLSYHDAASQADDFALAGYDDWRLPTIKEMYSLMDFRGIDPIGFETDDESGLRPFIDTDYFDFAYGDTEAGERLIDAQMASSNLYVSVTGPGKDRTMFGVNFADGRIKGYGLTDPRGNGDKLFYVFYVRGDPGYGVNAFTDHGDGTVTDATTGLMWMQDDSGEAMSWQDALAWAEAKNTESYLGHDDWRVPNVKELQSLVDYTRSPDTTGSPAIDPIFETTEITNEAGQADFPGFWSSTTHTNSTNQSGSAASYVNFGRAMGYMGGEWMDVHGAGAQRSDPKVGDPADFPEGDGPQGDAKRIYNHVRLVRDAK